MAEPRILHVNDQSRWGGGEGQTWLLIRELERLGVENHALVCAGSPLAERLATLLPPARLRLLPRALWGLLPLLLPALRPSCNVLHAHTGRSTLAFLAAGPARRVAHRRIPDQPAPAGLNRLKRADAVICVSEEIRRRLAQAGLGAGGRPRLACVHSSADWPEFPAVQARLEGRPALGFLGHFRRHKGLDLLLAALPAVLPVHPGLVLHLAGDGTEEAELRAMVHRLGLGAVVRFHPLPARPAEWLGGLDLFTMPSREEGLGSVALLAQALGLPVLATRAGGIPEGVLHGRTGWLVAPDDGPALAEGLARLLDDGELRLSLGAAGPPWVRENFSPRGMAQRTLAIYRELLA
ncbi:MAG: glycosyltransferase family 4 protein [bacterium]|jgi:glycosyltransferase involved in cell wall biosynthesis|nr:glycosyltransferase family 4 protein [bacterium]